MFVIPPCPSEGDLERVKRRPADWWRLHMEGWEFIAENRSWDSDVREWISRATGLHEVSPSEWANGAPDEWWKELARDYARYGSLNHALSAAIPFGENR